MLTLRDQFAIAALPALISSYGKTPFTMKIAYEVADEMLKAREPKQMPTRKCEEFMGMGKACEPGMDGCRCREEGGQS